LADRLLLRLMAAAFVGAHLGANAFREEQQALLLFR